MRKLAALAFVLGALLWANPSSAATCFWVGGTGTWDTSNTASWASGTGGTPGTCAATGAIPKQSGDIATFDGSSGGGTVTVNSNFNFGSSGTGGITCGAFTGTLDWSVNNNTLTAGAFNCSGSGARTLKCGTGAWTVLTWTMTTTTNLTYTCSTQNLTIAIGGTTTTAAMGGLTYGTVTLQGGNAGVYTGELQVTGANTYTNLSIGTGTSLNFIASTTQTVTNAFTWTGTSSLPIYVHSSSVGTTATIHASAVSSGSWLALRDLTFNTSAVTATNSFDLQHNSGVTITAPAAAGTTGGAYVFGG